MPNFQNDPVVSVSNSAGTPAVWGEGSGYEGVRGISHDEHGAVVGYNDWKPPSPPGAGGNGGWFESEQGEGVRGWAKGPDHAGVVGVNTAGDAIFGTTTSGRGVVGHSSTNAGVVGDSDKFDGVFGVSRNPTAAGVSGHSLNADGSVNRGGLAGFFDGNVTVTGDISLPGADCAEHFDIGGAQRIEPGTVVVIDREGALRRSEEAYDRKVAGVVSGAGGYRAGIVMDKQQSQGNRVPVALVGKVYCKVDAQYSPIEVGDLLTSSPTPGYAMKVDNPLRAFGAVIGKALCPLPAGQGLVPILIALQ